MCKESFGKAETDPKPSQKREDPPKSQETPGKAQIGSPRRFWDEGEEEFQVGHKWNDSGDSVSSSNRGFFLHPEDFGSLMQTLAPSRWRARR